DVEIEPENFLLRELALHSPRDEELGELAPPRLVEREEHVSSGLLRDRARALRLLVRNEIHDCRTQDAEVVDTTVPEELIVFRCEESLANKRRDLVVGHRYAALFADLRDELTTGGEHAQRHLHFDLTHRLD